MQEVVVIDYGMGNLHSVQKALSFLGAQPKLSQDAEEIQTAQKLILPGVGAFGDAMAELSRRGLVQAIQEAVEKGTPLMGICLGMQLLFESSTEGGWQQGLGLIPGEITKFAIREKVPHMGWNTIGKTNSKLFEGFTEEEFVYFVHSFYVPVCDFTAAETDYIHPFSAALHKDNFYATQFHPEKSGKTGERILRNFLDL